MLHFSLLELSVQLNVVFSNFLIKLDFIVYNSKQNAYLGLPKEKYPECQMDKKLLNAVNSLIPSPSLSTPGNCADWEQGWVAGGSCHSGSSAQVQQKQSHIFFFPFLPCLPLPDSHTAVVVLVLWVFFPVQTRPVLNLQDTIFIRFYLGC